MLYVKYWCNKDFYRMLPIIAWTLLFIIKTRFPASRSIAEIIYSIQIDKPKNIFLANSLFSCSYFLSHSLKIYTPSVFIYRAFFFSSCRISSIKISTILNRFWHPRAFWKAERWGLQNLFTKLDYLDLFRNDGRNTETPNLSLLAVTRFCAWISLNHEI